MDYREYIAKFEQLCEGHEVPDEVKELFLAMANELGSCQAALDPDPWAGK